MWAECIAVWLVALSPARSAFVQQASPAAYTNEKLDQLVAPIALFPDALLTQVLMASTYPLEIVEAQRWVSKNPKLEGAALEKALKDRAWDPSVKSLCAFPTVLSRMSDNLEWTQDLGNAFLAQQKDVMLAVQRMRAKAKEAGNLKSTNEQTVKTEGDVIIIESKEPEVIYVPDYSPTVVYAAPAVIVWSSGYHCGSCCWSHCDWDDCDVDIDVDRYNDFNRRTDARPTPYRGANSGRGPWQHDPTHRRGVNYRDSAVAQKYKGSAGASAATRDRARGYDSRGRTNTPTATNTNRSVSRQSNTRSTAWSGAQNRGADRAASRRGSVSRGAARGGGRGGRR